MPDCVPHPRPQQHTWKQMAKDLLQCMEMDVKSYRVFSMSQLKEFQGTESNC